MATSVALSHVMCPRQPWTDRQRRRSWPPRRRRRWKLRFRRSMYVIVAANAPAPGVSTSHRTNTTKRSTPTCLPGSLFIDLLRLTGLGRVRLRAAIRADIGSIVVSRRIVAFPCPCPRRPLSLVRIDERDPAERLTHRPVAPARFRSCRRRWCGGRCYNTPRSRRSHRNGNG